MARATVQIKTGSYTGTGSAQTITGVGFVPQVIIVKGGANHAVFRTLSMVGDSTAYLAANIANLAGSITGMTSDGFTVGTDVTANANATTYYYIALSGTAAQKYFSRLDYVGTGGARNVTTSGVTFQPDILLLKLEGAQISAARIALQTGDAAFHPNGNAVGTNEITGLLTNGFSLGTSIRINTSGSAYRGFAARHITNALTSGSYTGTGATQSINVGFAPDFVMVFNLNAATSGLLKTAAMATTTSHVLNNFSSITTGITALTSTGFTVGTTTAANNSGDTLYYIAGLSGNYNVPVARTVI